MIRGFSNSRRRVPLERIIEEFDERREGERIRVTNADNPTSYEDVAQKLTELSRVLIADDGLDASLQRVATLSTSLIHSCDGCGVSLSHDGSISTRAASDDRADRVDEIQYRYEEGPCLHAIETGTAVRVDSFDDEPRWTKFIEHAREEGVTASYSVPLTVKDHVVGSLNFYSCGGPFNEHDRQVGDLLAAQAAVGLRNAQTFADALAMVDQLTQALDSRDVIGQAKGMLMVRHDMDSDQAFDTLRTVSQHRNVKLRDVATMIVDGELDVADLPNSA